MTSVSMQKSIHYVIPFVRLTVTCNLQQKAGAGMVTAAATYGDLAADRVATVKWESEGVQLQVVVFGLAV